jgi:hypothetical protein
MKRLAVLLLVASTTLCLAQQPKTRPRPPASDWVSLFNGKDLTNWKPVGHERWTVEDGVIHGQGVSKEYGYLATEKTYKDFHLSLRFKCDAAGNSGVFFHSSFKPNSVDILGVQAEIDPVIGHHTAGLYGDFVDGTAGWMVWPAPENETVIRPYEWNEMLIRVEGNRIRVRLNSVDMVDFTNPRPAFTEGVIALQLHSGGEGNMRFKDLLIRDLSAR